MEDGDFMDISARLDGYTAELLRRISVLRGHPDISAAVADAIQFQASFIGHARTGVRIVLQDVDGTEAVVPMDDLIPMPEKSKK